MAKRALYLVAFAVYVGVVALTGNLLAGVAFGLGAGLFTFAVLDVLAEIADSLKKILTAESSQKGERMQ